jgi:uncharacterized protein YbjT (DUF2867 family)
MILVTGASGGAGGAVLQEMMKKREPLRAMYRSREEAAKAQANVTAVIADFADKQSLARALEAVDRVYLVCSPVRELVELESNMIDASRAAGVRHVVLNSALGAADYPKSFPSWHRKVEEKLKASGLSYTILQPNSFMQNIPQFYAPTIRAQGAFYSSVGNSKMSYIDVRDIAAVVAQVLTSPAAHSGKTYELNGPEALTSAEVAEKISRVAGRKVQYVDIPFESQKKAMLEMGLPEWQVTALLELQEYYTGGKGGDVDDVVLKIIGRPMIKLDQFLEEFVGSFRAEAAKA